MIMTLRKALTGGAAIWLLGIPVVYRDLSRPTEPLAKLKTEPGWAFFWPLLLVMLLDVRGWLTWLKGVRP
jgi:hypothetical protein